MCCQIDHISGIEDRTVCRCPNNPCKTNPVQENKIATLKAQIYQYWKKNANTGIVPPGNVPVTPDGSFSTVDNSFNIFYILFVIFIFLIIGLGIYFYNSRDVTPGY